MATKCKICHCEFRSEIEEMAVLGYSAARIASEITKKGFKVGSTTISRHLQNHTDLQLRSSQKPVQTREKSLTPDQIYTIVDSINIAEVHKKVGIPENLESPEEIVEAIQKYALATFLKLSALSNALIDRYAKDPDNVRFPRSEIAAWERSVVILGKAIALDERVSLAAAYSTLSNQGYEIKNPVDPSNVLEAEIRD